jgi:hypothetical protein
MVAIWFPPVCSRTEKYRSVVGPVERKVNIESQALICESATRPGDRWRRYFLVLKMDFTESRNPPLAAGAAAGAASFAPNSRRSTMQVE